LSTDATVSIQIIGSDFNVSSLPSNIIISFAYNASTNPNDLHCAWFDETTRIWEYDGCVQYIDTTNHLIHCVCSHLTIFATVESIQSGENLICDLFNEEWRYTHLIFFILLAIITCYLSFQLLPFIISKKPSAKILFSKHFQLIILNFVLVIALLNMITCLLFYLQIIDWTDPSIISLVTFLILLPLIFYFMMFSAILFSWITIAKSMQQNSYTLMQHIKKALIIANIVYIAMTIAQIILLLTSFADDHISLWLQISWMALMLVSIAGFGFFGWKMISLILETAQRMQMMQRPTVSKSSTISTNAVQTNGNDEYKIAKKLGLVAVIILLFFLMQFVLSLYYLLDLRMITLTQRVLDLSSHLMCLGVVCFLYHGSITTLKHRLFASDDKCCHCVKNVNVRKRKGNSRQYDRSEYDKTKSGHTVS